RPEDGRDPPRRRVQVEDRGRAEVNRRAPCTALLLALTAAPPAAPSQAVPAAARDGDARVVGRIRAPSLEIAVALESFTAFVLVPEAATADGATTLDALVQERIVAVEAQRRGLSIDEPALDRRLRDLDEKILKSTGGKKGIDDFRKEQHLSLAELRDKIRMSVLAERMMADDFGLSTC